MSKKSKTKALKKIAKKHGIRVVEIKLSKHRALGDIGMPDPHIFDPSSASAPVMPRPLFATGITPGDAVRGMLLGHVFGIGKSAEITASDIDKEAYLSTLPTDPSDTPRPGTRQWHEHIDGIVARLRRENPEAEIDWNMINMHEALHYHMGAKR